MRLLHCALGWPMRSHAATGTISPYLERQLSAHKNARPARDATALPLQFSATASEKFHERNEPPIPETRFPIINDTGAGLIGAKSLGSVRKAAGDLHFRRMAPRDVIDATAETFSLYPEHMAFSPLTFKKR